MNDTQADTSPFHGVVYFSARRRHFGQLVRDADRTRRKAPPEQTAELWRMVAREASAIAAGLDHGGFEPGLTEIENLEAPRGWQWNVDDYSASPAEPVNTPGPASVLERLYHAAGVVADVELLVRPDDVDSAVHALGRGPWNTVALQTPQTFPGGWAGPVSVSTLVPHLFRTPRSRFAAMGRRIGRRLERAGLTYRVTSIELAGTDYLEPLPKDWKQ